jgi:RNA polymerase sigma-70 factor (ECF subfamily)
MTDPGRQARQREELTRWVRDHGHAVQGFLQALVRDRDAAEDLLQEVFCRAWQARDRYAETGKERSYLLRIADRLACDRARCPKREQVLSVAEWQQVEPVNGEEPPWEGLAHDETRRQLAAALDALSEPQRRTLLLRFYGEMEFSEIAQTMGCPLNTVLSHNRRGLLAMKDLLQEKCLTRKKGLAKETGLLQEKT